MHFDTRSRAKVYLLFTRYTENRESNFEACIISDERTIDCTRMNFDVFSRIVLPLGAFLTDGDSTYNGAKDAVFTRAERLLDGDVDELPLLPEKGERKPRIQSAVRTISILLAVADSADGLKAKEIMKQVGLPRQVAYHLIHTMLGTGIIRKNESNRYVLGLTAVSIAEGFHRQLAPPEQLARKVRSIVAAIGETAHAGGLG